MTELTSALDSRARTERRTALRALLVRPLTLARDDADLFAAIVRHRDWLARWFAENPAWRLVVDPSRGFARLHKVPARLDATRPARLQGKPAFDRRRYVLLCWTLAALDDCRSQTTLARLAEIVRGIGRDEPDIEAFDPDVFAERRAFVDVLRWLADMGVLALRDGDVERFAQTRDGDALYDVNDRLLGQLLAAPVPPALAGAPSGLLDEHHADTEEGRRQRARHDVLRRLLDDPVLYYDEMDDAAREWLDHSRGFLYRLLQDDAGFAVERRREGLAPVDPAGEVSDTLFPDGGSTVKHAALLLAEHLTSLARRGARLADRGAVVARVADLMAHYGRRCGWSQQYAVGPEGAADLADDAMGLLEAFGLAARQGAGEGDGWALRPALARFAAGPAVPAEGVVR